MNKIATPNPIAPDFAALFGSDPTEVMTITAGGEIVPGNGRTVGAALLQVSETHAFPVETRRWAAACLRIIDQADDAIADRERQIQELRAEHAYTSAWVGLFACLSWMLLLVIVADVAWGIL
jgi:uncharacterized Ntn-hydrolase superfamily protein